MHIGGAGENQNPYVNINAVLAKLGIVSSARVIHNTHFHIYLRPPVALELPHNLNADSANEINAVDAATGADQAFNISYNEDSQTGEATMFMSLLMPYLPPLDNAPVAPPAIVVAQAETTTSKSDMTLGNCEDVQTPDNPNGQLGGGISCCTTTKLLV